MGLGFTPENWEPLDLELRSLVLENMAELGEQTSFGQKYIVRGRIKTPRGKTANIVTVWIVLKGEQAPRLVTLYPGA